MFPGPARTALPCGNRLQRAVISACLAGGLTLALAGSALASNANIPFNGSVSYDAAAGETNDVAVTISAGTTSGAKVVFSDPAVTITAGTGCTVDGTGHVATCDNLSIQFVLLNLGDGNDSDTASGPFHTLGVHLQVFGGSGTDTLAGGDGDDFIAGDHSGTGETTLNDTPANDTIDGGTGFDAVSYFFAPSAVTATVNGTGGTSGETDTYSSIEELDGSDGFGDTLTTDGAGGNKLIGFGFDDTLNSDDGRADQIDCDHVGFEQHPGTADVSNADAVDTVDADCETINRSTKNLGGGGTGGGTTGGATTGGGGGGGGAPAPAPAPAPTPPPAAPLATTPTIVPVVVPQSSQLLVAAGSVTMALKGSLFLIPGISEQCTAGPCQVLERVYLLTGSARAALNHPIARDRDTLQSGQVNSARLRLTHKASRQLKRRGKLRVEGLVTLTDAKGKTQTVRKKFTLRARKG